MLQSVIQIVKTDPKAYFKSGQEDPGPLKCFSAPRHQILAKSAPQKARTHNKAEFATKVCKSC